MRILDEQARAEASDRFVDERAEDRLGPLGRVGGAIDALSGAESGWVSASEVCELLLEDAHVERWAVAASELTGLEMARLVSLLVDTWSDLELAGVEPLDVVFETSITEEGQSWRTIRPTVETPDGIAGVVVAQLVDRGGSLVGETAGRTQISMPEFEVFVGIDTEPTPGTAGMREWATVVSALVGTEVSTDAPLEPVLAEFLADPNTPADLRVQLDAGIGTQVWLDRALPPEVRSEAEIDPLLEEFLIQARRLARLVAPFDAWAEGTE